MGFAAGQEIIDFIRRKETYYKKTFSQAGEDVIILDLINHFKLKNFSWIDIGAHHPLYFSNTALLYKKGYRGVNIEGDSSLIGEFYRKRRKDINLNVLISNKEDELDFYIMDSPTLNTISSEEASNLEKLGHKITKKVKVKTTTVSNIIDQYCDGKFPDLLTLDAEGHDLEILKSIEWNETSPKIICVETIPYNPVIKDNFDSMHENEITKYILENGYFIVAYTGINTIFFKKETHTDYLKTLNMFSVVMSR